MDSVKLFFVIMANKMKLFLFSRSLEFREAQRRGVESSTGAAQKFEGDSHTDGKINKAQQNCLGWALEKSDLSSSIVNEPLSDRSYQLRKIQPKEINECHKLVDIHPSHWSLA